MKIANIAGITSGIMLMILLSGILLQFLAFTGLFYGLYLKFALFLFFLPLFYLSKSLFLQLNYLYFDKKGRLGYLLVCFLLVILLSHFVQVLVPETGFDAVWYHLPVAKAIVDNGKIIYSPEYYQSLNPLFADLYFTAGYGLATDFVLLGGEIGAKLVAYTFMLYFLWGVWRLARLHLVKVPALLLLCMVATFQVVSWQAASFYIDIAKGFFEIVALYYLSLFFQVKSKNQNETQNFDNKNLIYAALFLGASLASKVFSILLLPVFLIIIVLHFFQNQSIKKIFINTSLFILFSLILPTPFYLFSYYHSGQFVPSVNIHVDKLAQIGGEQNLVTYVLQRAISLPFSVFQILLLRDYVSPFVGIFLIVALKNWRQEISIFAIGAWLIFWFVPPVSTRYAIAGFAVLLIIGLKQIFQKKFEKINNQQFYFYIFLFSIIITFLPRIYVNYRSLKYLFSSQTQQKYIEQFYDGNIDDKLKMWYDHF